MKSPNQFLESYRAAVREKNVGAYVALYAEDVRVFDMWKDWQLHGLAGWKEMAEGWFGSLGDEYVSVAFDETQLRETSELAFITTLVRYSGHAADGKELRALNERMTVVLEKRGAEWKVAHQHTSAPIDHATLKASLQRA